MKESHSVKIAAELRLRLAQVNAVAGLLAEGATVPFIARYRKEHTGELDEVAITAIRDRIAELGALDARRDSIMKSLAERNLLTDELSGKIAAAETLAALEDLYLPFRPKRRTRAMIARERGLEPLADIVFAQDASVDPQEAALGFVNAEKEVPDAEAALGFVNAEKEVPDAEAALAGARDIIAEKVNEDADARAEMRAFFERNATVVSRVTPGKETDGAKFRDYFDWSEPLSKVAGHRALAMFRGENEECLYLSIRPDKDAAIKLLQDRFVHPSGGAAADQVALAVADSYSRLMCTAMEVEMRMELRNRAGDEAIGVFSSNLRELLMAPALGQKAVLAIDPGIRTGCKVVCLDPQGKLLFDTVLHLSASDAQRREAAQVIMVLCDKFRIEAIAIGNGTYGRESEAFVRALGLPKSIAVVSVNESGASIYSASEVAREEFPDKDITVRGSVSIGRRLMDPLAELVKIDPKSIGVGQYQHDVDQAKLKKGLDDVVVSCVNSVGVEVNTASRQLLAYVSGLGPALADNIVKYRDENGPFKSRSELMKVPRLGAKAFEQCAGFLRIRGAKNPLDASAVHPERYELVERMASDAGCGVADLLADSARRESVDIAKYVSDSVGLPTLRDIMSELAKPGRDPRKEFELFSFAEEVKTIDDLSTNMKLPGIVTNVAKFGAFVDIGVHQDGLVHVSELADRFVSDPAEVVKVGQKVQVTVIGVDKERNRISLSMKSVPGSGGGRRGERRGDDAPQGGSRNDRVGPGDGGRRGGYGRGGRGRDENGGSRNNRGAGGGWGDGGSPSSGGLGTLGDLFKF